MLPGQIAGVGSYVPKLLLTNETIAADVPGVSPDWTRAHLGISERRIASVEDTAGAMAAQAAKGALKAAQVHFSEIELIIVATSSRSIPPVASYVQSKLGHVSHPHCPAFDLNAVCAGFIGGLIMAYQMLSHYDNILLIGVDAFSRITDWQNRNCVFFGDGAGAVVVRREASKGIASHVLTGTPDKENAFSLAPTGTWRMNGPAVFAAAMKALPPAIDWVLSEAGLTPLDIAHVIPHQASLNLLQNVAQQSELPFEKFRLTLDKYGNTAAASIPLTLDKHRDAIKEGDRVLFFGIGAGWNWGAAVLTW